MNKPLQSQLVKAFFVLGSLFMAVVGILGSIGWSGDASNQKWWALFCGLIGVAGVVVFWKLDEITDEEVAAVVNADEWIKGKSIEAQRRYWKKERRDNSIGAVVILAILVVGWLFWGEAREYLFLSGYLFLTTVWCASKRLRQIARELKQLTLK